MKNRFRRNTSIEGMTKAEIRTALKNAPNTSDAPQRTGAPGSLSRAEKVSANRRRMTGVSV